MPVLIFAGRAPISPSQEAKMNMPADPATQVVIVGGGPVGLGSRDRARPARRPLHPGRALRQPAADPEGPEPDPAHAGAFLFLGRGGRAARGAHDPAGLRHRRPHRLRHAARRLPLRLAAARAGAALLFHRQRAAAAIRDRGGAARIASAELPTVETLLRLERGGSRAGRRRRAGRRSPSATATGRATLRADYVVGCDGSRSIVREHGRHHADAHRSRPADGAAGVPLDRTARAAGALSRQVVLQRAASGAEGLLEVLRPRRSRQHLVLPRPGAARHHAKTISISAACCTRRSARNSTSSSSTSASGTCASRSPTATAAAASSSPATRRTAIRPMAATASTPGSRTPPISAGSLPRRCKAGPARPAGFLWRRAAAGVRVHRARFHREGDRKRPEFSGQIRSRAPTRLRSKPNGRRARPGRVRK